MHAAAPGSGNAFGLPLPDGLPFVFGYKGEQLQNHIADEGAQEIFFTASIQQGHIEYFDIRLLTARDKAPLLQNFLIVPTKAIDAFYNQQISLLKDLVDQATVGWAVKILAALEINIDIFLVDSKSEQLEQLSVFVLVPCGDSDVAVGFAVSHILFLLKRKVPAANVYVTFGPPCQRCIPILRKRINRMSGSL
jgi:hypothetical protein